jgi:monoamine oxidase
MGCCGAKHPKQDVQIVPEECTFKGKAIVIGAGASGLVAGKLLKENGAEVQIIEASSRFGGRIRDADPSFAPFRVAVGAEWVHAKHALMGHDANCPIFEDITNNTSEEHEIFPDKVADLNVYQKGKMSKAGWMDKKIFNMDGDNKFKKSSWYNVLETRVLPSVWEDIIYEQQVTAINYEGDKVTVTTKDGTTYEADKVLVTVPIAILQKDVITFTPPMPAEKATALKKVKTLPGCKVFLEFKEKFYPHFVMMKPFTEGGWAHLYFDETVGKVHKEDKHIMCGVLLGDDVYKMITEKGTDDASIKDYCLKELDGIFDGKATANLLNYVVLDWTTQPYILQGIPDYEKLKPADLKDLATPIGNKVFFAGDGMNPDPHNNAYVQGACEASYVAVKKMLMT